MPSKNKDKLVKKEHPTHVDHDHARGLSAGALGSWAAELAASWLAVDARGWVPGAYNFSQGVSQSSIRVPSEIGSRELHATPKDARDTQR